MTATETAKRIRFTFTPSHLYRVSTTGALTEEPDSLDRYEDGFREVEEALDLVDEARLAPLLRLDDDEDAVLEEARLDRPASVP